MRCERPLRWLALPAALLGAVMYLKVPSSSQLQGEGPVLKQHIQQADIDRGRIALPALVEAGRFLFSAKFNLLDGFGRPAATGNGTPTKRLRDASPFVLRTSGPDANSCAGCHNDPEPGGAGDFVANVFVLAQVLDPVTESVGADQSNERNTLGMHGSGLIEALAVEMSQELIAIREEAIRSARSSQTAVTKRLITKDVDFGRITARPDGSVDTSEVEGVDPDLIIKPFHQKGVVNSLRVFTVNAYNHHHGMQAVERFGRAQTGTDDFDEDGVRDELSVGDITAATLFQATLPPPLQVMPRDSRERMAVRRGEEVFSAVGCADCHRPALVLKRPIFQEPNPFNPAGNLRMQDVPKPIIVNLAAVYGGHRVAPAPGGGVIVRAFTDLKRHRIADEGDRFFANERIIQGGVPTDVFLTRKLWDCGSSAPYGHRGDCTTISEAIIHHAGAARGSRNRYLALPENEKAAVIAFLSSLRVVPEK